MFKNFAKLVSGKNEEPKAEVIDPPETETYPESEAGTDVEAFWDCFTDCMLEITPWAIPTLLSCEAVCLGSLIATGLTEGFLAPVAIVACSACMVLFAVFVGHCLITCLA